MFFSNIKGLLIQEMCSRFSQRLHGILQKNTICHNHRKLSASVCSAAKSINRKSIDVQRLTLIFSWALRENSPTWAVQAQICISGINVLKRRKIFYIFIDSADLIIVLKHFHNQKYLQQLFFEVVCWPNDEDLIYLLLASCMFGGSHQAETPGVSGE